MTIRVPFLDLAITDDSERGNLLQTMDDVLQHGRLVMGPEIEQFETQVATYCGRAYAVSVGSGTDALFLGLRALRIGHGDEVITTSLSWIATANAIALTGASPVFADIGGDLNIDPVSVERLITARTRAILAVDYTGQIADMDALVAICDRYNLHLVEDGSQAFGASQNGHRCGSFGTISAISHNPMKVLAAIGEAGSILCDDPEIYHRLISLRYNGTVNRETCTEPSLNGRMDTLQAAVLLQRLKTVDDLIRCRRDNAAYYIERLGGKIGLPKEKPEESQVYYTFTIQTPERDALEQHLAKRGIETKVQHRLIMPEHPAYKPARGEYACAQALSETILSLPVHEKLTASQREFVVDAILEFLEQSDQSKL